VSNEPGLSWRFTQPTPRDILVTADAEPIRPGWAWGGSTGHNVRVCIVDSGVDQEHPLVGPVVNSWSVVRGDAGYEIEPSDAGDECGHGTACAGIVRRTAADCELYSLRVLGGQARGSGDMLLAGLRWAVQQGFDVINLSLSTTRAQFCEELRAIADAAYFNRTIIVASAHNTPVESFPWRFASVISVGSHALPDPELFFYNPVPPVEFFAPGQDIEIAWPGGRTRRSSGNSFATPFIAGLCARILGRHPRMTAFQLKNALYLSAANVTVEKGAS
jgi:subtilisin family serine protease